MNRNASFNSTGKRVPTKQVWQPGDVVRLTTEVRRRTHITLDKTDFGNAHIVELTDLLGPTTVVLDREVMGSKVWEKRQLVRVSSAKWPRHELVPLHYRQSLMPAAKRCIRLDSDTCSNLDFGFTAQQAAVLDRFEAALKANEHPCVGGDHRRECRAEVVASYHYVLENGLRSALTDLELSAAVKCFGEPVLP